MKITSINIPKEFKDNGLAEIKMDRMGQIVLLAGKNGAGKTRVLDKIRSIAHDRLDAQALALAVSENKNFRERIIKLAELKTKDPTVEDIKEKNVETWKANINRNKTSISKTQMLKLDDEARKCKIINFVPKSFNLDNPLEMAKGMMNNKAKEVILNLGCDTLAGSTLPALQSLQDRWHNATHQHSTIPAEEERQITEEYTKLQNNLKLFIGNKLDRNSDGDATLFGFPIGSAKLSDGQKVLLQLCVAIHCQGAKLCETIIFMDEPENHLHPNAIIEAIDILKKNLPNGQIWIATHSVNILSYFFDSTNLWYVDEGTVNFEGRTPEKVLDGLLGDDEKIAKMRGFIDYPAQLARTRFACECLCPPCSVTTSAEDPQTGQVKQIIQSLYAENQPVKILDWGAGKGRLLANLSEDNKDEIRQKIDYVAWDSFSSDSDFCKSTITGIYGKSDDRYFNDFTALCSMHNEKSFHLIVLCNVLHEIPHDEWLARFKEISDLLIDNGVLLIVEDQRMPVGEKAHKNGFIVLDTPSLKRLFNVSGKSDNDFVFNDAKGDGRLKAHLIKKHLLASATNDTLKRAFEFHKEQSINKIKELRQTSEHDYKAGQLHAFWSQQFTNTHLALETR